MKRVIVNLAVFKAAWTAVVISAAAGTPVFGAIAVAVAVEEAAFFRPHLLVDEMQDVSRIQADIVAALRRPGGCFSVVAVSLKNYLLLVRRRRWSWTRSCHRWPAG